jgi:hypothetical protein
MAVADFLFQGAAPVQQPTGSDSTTNFPAWLQEQTYNASNAAFNLANQPYTPYPGQEVAPPSPATTASWQMAQNNVGSYKPDLAQAGALTQAAGTPVSEQDISNYLNPYTKDVTGALARLAGQNLSENLLPSVNDTFIKNGSFGGSQDSEFNNRAVRDTQASLLNAQAGALQQGYQGALTAAQAQKAQEGSVGAQFGQLGALGTQLGAADVSQVAGAGQAQDTLAQQNINASMNNFQQQQQWPYQNLAFASNIIHGLPVGSTTQTAGLTTPSSYAPSPLASGLGTYALSNGLKMRRGGRVRRPVMHGALALAA